jgi:hypothetical protein
MATFNQQAQNVTHQNNAGRDINITQPRREGDAVVILENLQQLVAQAKKQGILDEETSTDAEYQITKALQQTKKSNPEKNSILTYLDTAKQLLEGVTAAGGLVTALIDAAEVIRRIF